MSYADKPEGPLLFVVFVVMLLTPWWDPEALTMMIKLLFSHTFGLDHTLQLFKGSAST